MPVRNEAAFIERSVGAVLAQDYPSHLLEVIVVDGDSNDGTKDIVRRLAKRSRSLGGPSVSVLDNPRRIVAAGLNLAIERMRGEMMIRVDGHCEIARDYVSRCVEAIERTGADNVGGRQRAVARSAVGRAIAVATGSRFGVGNARFRYSNEPGWADTVYLGAYPRAVFEKLGGFDEELVRNQDDEFNFRLLQSGGKIWLDPSIKSVYKPRESLRSLWRQYREYGMYKVLVIRKRGGVARISHLVPTLFVVTLTASLVAAGVTRRPIVLGSVAGPYMLANAAASVHAANDDPGIMPLLPMTFATLHIAYGFGFLEGLWRWRKRAGVNRVQVSRRTTR